jgi:hypothetical protein
MFVANDSEILRKGRRDRPSFVRNLLVEESHTIPFQLDEGILRELFGDPKAGKLNGSIGIGG